MSCSTSTSRRLHEGYDVCVCVFFFCFSFSNYHLRLEVLAKYPAWSCFRTGVVEQMYATKRFPRPSGKLIQQWKIPVFKRKYRIHLQNIHVPLLLVYQSAKRGTNHGKSGWFKFSLPALHIQHHLVYNLFRGLTTYIYRGYNPFTKYNGHPSSQFLYSLCLVIENYPHQSGTILCYQP